MDDPRLSPARSSNASSDLLRPPAGRESVSGEGRQVTAGKTGHRPVAPAPRQAGRHRRASRGGETGGALQRDVGWEEDRREGRPGGADGGDAEAGPRRGWESGRRQEVPGPGERGRSGGLGKSRESGSAGAGCWGLCELGSKSGKTERPQPLSLEPTPQAPIPVHLLGPGALCSGGGGSPAGAGVRTSPRGFKGSAEGSSSFYRKAFCP